MSKPIIIGSRGSELALWQANHIQTQLADIGLNSEIQIIKTQGDNFVNLSFSKLEGKGFFTKELEEALLDGRIDLAVHSHKDLPTESPEGLCIAAVSERETPNELLIILKECVDITQGFSLKLNAKVGTSSSRRQAQLGSLRTDITFEELRGNVPTRIQKLRDKKYDAIILAKAGVERLKIDLNEFHVEEINHLQIVPAPAQGVLALQTRSNNIPLIELLKPLHHPQVAETIAVERQILNLFEGGCQLPLGAYCHKINDMYELWVSKANSANDFPERIYIQTKLLTDIPNKVVQHFNKKKNRIKSIFISRELKENSFLRRSFNKFALEIDARTLIRIVPIIHKFDSYILEKVDWIFFNSKNAVDNFFNLNPIIPKNIKFGVVGRGSESLLRKYNHIPDFVGDTGDIKLLAEKLCPLVEGKTILFPQAKDSLRTIQTTLWNRLNSIDVPVYDTIMEEDIIPSNADIMIFTSPSNVDAYFSDINTVIESYQHIIAIGKSTASKLEEFGYKNVIIPHTPDEIGLSEAVYGIL